MVFLPKLIGKNKCLQLTFWATAIDKQVKTSVINLIARLVTSSPALVVQWNIVMFRRLHDIYPFHTYYGNTLLAGLGPSKWILRNNNKDVRFQLDKVAFQSTCFMKRLMMPSASLCHAWTHNVTPMKINKSERCFIAFFRLVRKRIESQHYPHRSIRMCMDDLFSG